MAKAFTAVKVRVVEVEGGEEGEEGGEDVMTRAAEAGLSSEQQTRRAAVRNRQKKEEERGQLLVSAKLFRPFFGTLREEGRCIARGRTEDGFLAGGNMKRVGCVTGGFSK